MQQKWKTCLCVLCCVAALCMPFLRQDLTARATETTTTTDEPTEEADSTDNTPSKGVFIAEFLIIFTVVCAGTAYLVARPSLKKLKAAREATQTQTEQENHPKL